MVEKETTTTYYRVVWDGLFSSPTHQSGLFALYRNNAACSTQSKKVSLSVAPFSNDKTTDTGGIDSSVGLG